ncbi:hypothetical protein MM236_00850 [Belliella sp. DSM 107340]|uniref:Glucosamine inositolphosphorylceramide transferase 1 N-terminal domain-containing protein n=1 Tax=Belliella calami TaxID=2923436 RepID=A0ABS9UJ17_9BACT|nr:hypothetical protein [Belliella calami]MCH7396508.1 hypothetical protein [Belliella calami]
MQNKLKIGLLLDNLSVPAWAWEMVKVIIHQNLADVRFIVLNQKPKPSGKKSPLLYRVFSKIERTVFKTIPNAFERKNILEIENFKPKVIKVNPVQKKFSDSFENQDLEEIKEQEPDVLIRLGFRVLKGELLDIPKLGIWSYHHGDNLVNKGGPPCFWEVMLGWNETGSVLQILTDKLDAGNVIYRSLSRTDPLSVHRNANKVYWKSLFFIPRQLTRINSIGVLAWREEVKKKALSIAPSNPELFKPPGNLRMISLFFSWSKRNVYRKFHEFFNKEVWEIWLSKKDSGKKVKISNPEGNYLADPFLIEKEGGAWLFAEQYCYKKNKGSIAIAKIENDKVSGFQTIIEEAYHLSYPFVWEENGTFWMYVESAAKAGLRLYKAEKSPYDWKLFNEKMLDQKLYDPTICKKDGLYWLFANQKAHPSTSSFDELYLYYSEDFVNGNWISHPQNPIVSDVKSSRPAGALFEKDGDWYRPAQDSAKHYGHRVKIQKIIKWNIFEYEEVTTEVVEADWQKDLKGTHTINRSENFLVTDSFRR